MVSRGSPRPRLPQGKGLIRPMLATPGELPTPADDDRWAYEMKWDGVRAIGYLENGGTRLVSRNDIDISVSYPEVLGLSGALGAGAVVDGELVAFDDRGAPSFGRLQERMHVKDAAVARRLAGRVPVVYLVFDVLRLGDRALLDAPYLERRDVLDGLGIAGPSWQAPPSFLAPGADVLAASLEQRLEGVVAKRRESRYRPGQRSPDWRKVKHVRMQEVVVVGWRPGKGRRAGGIGSLLLGVNSDRGLVFAGGVGTGFTERMLADLATRLRPLARATSPLAEQPAAAEVRDAHWVTPRLVGEVAYTEWTPEGRIRHPSWRGLRPDKAPSEVYPAELH